MDFWLQYGQQASVDWCEPNYIVSPYVAEWYNCISSLPILFGAIFGIWYYRNLFGNLLPRYYIGFVGMALVGLGSAAFHGTLLRYPQASDELPMVYLGTHMLYLIIFRGKGRHYHDAHRTKMNLWAIIMVLYLVFFTLTYFLYEDYFIFFISTINCISCS